MTQTTLDSPDHYTIGWIAALPIERAAATALLDERHDKPQCFSQHPSDTNSYTWGRMGEHNIVIASLPAGVYGTTSAATTASSLLSSLPQIRIGLLVGIGGGIARPEEGMDIRLGDVVVSQPDGATGGVVQYDLVKAKSGGERERKDFLNMPPPVLLHALANLQAEHFVTGAKLPTLLKDMWMANPLMAKSTKSAPGFVYQGRENDRLFKASYKHAGGRDCRGCDPHEELQRDMRDSTDPEIHYGIIASGSTLVKDADKRDKVAAHVGEECLCVEMEAAGLMNHYPCLVIRGICDYADSHKNDRWQPYASATAAAFAKELLIHIPTSDLQKTRRAVELLQSIETRMQHIEPKINTIYVAVDSLKSDAHLDKLKRWLSPPNPSTNRNAAKEKRHEGTGNWFITSTAFLEWKSGSRRHLWLHGLAGCGKTVLISTILDHLQNARPDLGICVEFFFDFRDQDKQHLDNLLRSLAFQLYSQCADAREDLDSLFTMMQRPQKLRIILDALDECATRAELLDWMKILACADLTRVHLFATSRREDELESSLGGWIQNNNMIPIDKDLVNEDIRSYVKARLQSSKDFQKRWASQRSVLEEIESAIGEKADGMFRWAACQLDILEGCLDYDELESALRSLPQDLDQTYSRILTSIPEGRREKAVRILQFLTYSERPLTIQEAVDAIAIRLDADRQFDPKYKLPCPNEITRFCSSLVSLVTRRSGEETVTELELAHFSVKEYLMSNNTPEPFRCGLSEPDARSCITRCCLAYLSCLRTEEPIDKVRAQFPLARYSAQYWMDHAKPAETLDGVTETIICFFQDCTTYAIWTRLFDPERRCDEHPDPLYFASLKGLHASVRILIENGADVNAQGGVYGNALQAASSEGHKHIVQMLLEKGADVN
ncbi:putative vegetative incompatibility protein, partial [Achaetomium macrosporum]